MQLKKLEDNQKIIIKTVYDILARERSKIPLFNKDTKELQLEESINSSFLDIQLVMSENPAQSITSIEDKYVRMNHEAFIYCIKEAWKLGQLLDNTVNLKATKETQTEFIKHSIDKYND